MKKLLDYFSPHRRIARKLRWLQKFTGEKGFYIAATEFATLAKDFEEYEP